MKTCQACGSSEVVTDLAVLHESHGGSHPIYFEMIEPEPAKPSFSWAPDSAINYIHATACGKCGNVQLFVENSAELLALHNKGYKGNRQED
ncbi:MAG: hypothetical protein HZB29_02875 [Nitrospinae bacterium]|nr:hypothetical protein [Nitrospinota bacterium]